MVKPLALLVLSITSENVLKIHSRQTQMLFFLEAEGKGPITRTFYQHEIYFPEIVCDNDHNSLRDSTFLYSLWLLVDRTI